ncbi:MAG: ABC transporter substrate-binding protein [Candidatus Hermodarchaeota archaeon]|nr:ABC transporter substrate-binding protein [Candidatus Hermodarchaeota archaeon]
MRHKPRITLWVGVVFFCILIFIQGCSSLSSQPIPSKTWTYPDGYDPHGGYLDRVTFVVYPPEDEQLGLQALQANIIYAWDEHVSAENITELEAAPGVEVATEPGDLYRMFALDCGTFPMNITGYRRAIAFALDKYAVVQGSTDGLGLPQDCAIPRALTNWTYESQLTETYYAQDIVKANASLEAAGFRDLTSDGWRDYDADLSGTLTSGDKNSHEVAISFLYTGHIPLTNAITLAIEGLAKCGIRAYTVPWDPYDPIGRYYDVGTHTINLKESGDLFLLYHFFHSSTGANEWYFGGWRNDTYNQYAENLMAARTKEEVQYWTWKCQEILWYEQPMIVCYNDVFTNAYRTDIWEDYINMQGRNRIGNGYSLVHIKLKEEAGGPFGCFPTEYIMSLNEGLDTTNSLRSNSEYTKTVFQLVYERLWTYSPYDWTPQPSLAYAWETEATVASGDIQEGEKYTFHLFENATWHDGTPVTADDVAFSVSLGLQDPYNAENYQHVYKTNIVDNMTIEIFTNATGFFEWTRATGFTVYPAHIWSLPSSIFSWVPTVPELVGSGPYIFAAYVQGQYVVLDRNPEWHFAVSQPPRTPCPVTVDCFWCYPLLLGIIIIQVCILVYLVNRRRSRDASKK